MFGFGRSKNEKAVISLVTAQFESLGIPREDATESATKMVDQVLADLRPSGVDPYKTTQGDEYVLQKPFVSPRLSAGLKVEDIRFHWNRPLVVVFCEMKMREMFNFMVVDMARQQGQDESAASSRYKKTFPRYGDPSKWDPNEKFNAGLREIDADLYPEFSGRLDSWQKRTSALEVTRLIELHGTLNAVARHLIASGAL